MILQYLVTALGALFPAGCVAFAVAAWCWLKLSRLIAGVFVVCFLSAVGAAVTLKLVADGIGPPLENAGLFALTRGAPSGHAVDVTVVYGCAAVLFARLWKNGLAVAGLIGCLAVIALVCITRVTLQAHTIGDVAAGVAVGLAFVALFDRAMRTQARGTGASPLGLQGLMTAAALLALASGVRISSAHFL